MMSNNADVVQVHPENISCAHQNSAAENRKVLTEIQVEQWRENGFLLVDNIFSESAIISALSDIMDLQTAKKGDEDL